MSDYEQNPPTEKDVDDMIADILDPYEGYDIDLDAVDALLDELNADVIKAFTLLNEVHPELQFNAEEHLEKCKNDLPVSDIDAELFEQIATIVDYLPLEDTFEVEVVARKIKIATKIITSCSPQLQSISLRALDILVPVEPQVHTLSDDEIRLLSLTHNGIGFEREDEYSYTGMLMRGQLIEEVENNIRATYGEFDALHSVAYNLLDLGAYIGGIHWERYHTDDAPENIRERNFQDALKEIKLRKMLHFREGPIPDDDIDMLLLVMKDLALSYLQNYIGLRKE